MLEIEYEQFAAEAKTMDVVMKLCPNVSVGVGGSTQLVSPKSAPLAALLVVSDMAVSQLEKIVE